MLYIMALRDVTIIKLSERINTYCVGNERERERERDEGMTKV